MLLPSFMDYAQSARHLNVEDKSSWQWTVWEELFGSQSTWTPFFEQVRKIKKGFSSLDKLYVYGFGFSFLNPTGVAVFEKLAESTATSLYVLSPCSLFWGDLLSSYQTTKLLETQVGQEEIQEYFLDSNPLLANFGQLGQEFFTQLEDLEATSAYVIGKQWRQDPSYQELWHDECVEQDIEKTVLSALQTDLLLMRSAQEPHLLSSSDYSIQIHQTLTKMDEVQLVHDLLLKEKNLLLSDVLVLAPKIEEYEAAIEMVFGACAFPYVISDRTVSEPGGVWQIIDSFFELIEKGLDAPRLLSFCSQPAVASQFRLTADDLEFIKRSFEEGGALEGLSQGHQKKIYDLREVDEVLSFESWVEQLFLESLDPCTASRRLGSLAKLLGLFKRLSIPIFDGKRQSLAAWVDYLFDLVESFCDEKSLSNSQRREKEALFDTLLVLRQKGEVFLSWESFHSIWDKQLRNRLGTWEALEEQAIRFASLSPMRAVPAKYLIIMGMDATTLPRISWRQPFEWTVAQGVDYRPSQSDLDRYLFLEALISAREKLIFTYSHEGCEEKMEPSQLLVELIEYLDKMASFAHLSFSQHAIFKHGETYDNKAPVGLSKQRFEKNASTKQGPLLPLEKIALSLPPDLEVDLPKSINLDKLAQLVKRPIAYYLSQNLGCYLPWSEDAAQLLPSALGRRQLKNGLLEEQLNFNKQGRQRALPSGIFEKLVQEKVRQDCEEQLKALKGEALELNLTRAVKNPYAIGSTYLLPPLQVSQTLIEGFLGQPSSKFLLTTEGAFVDAKLQLESLVEVWPYFLTLMALDFKKVKPALHFLKSPKVAPLTLSKSSAQEELEKLLHYASYAKKWPSPLASSQITYFLEGEPQAWNQGLEKDLSGPFFASSDLSWALGSGCRAEAAVWLENWDNLARPIFEKVKELSDASL